MLHTDILKLQYMKKPITILLTWFMLLPTYMSAQILTAERQMPCYRDSFEVYKMPYVTPGDNGQNCTWDFSNLPVDSAEVVSVEHYASSGTDTMYMGVHREHANRYYHFAQDTLWLTGYETSRTQVRYKTPLPWLRFPFAYGDSVSGTFSGKGQYCHIMPLTPEGQYSACADAVGCLVLPDIVIDSALRVHSRIQQYDNVHSHARVMEDCYSWYSPYCRYPLLEAVHVQTFKNTDTVSFASLYYFPQEEKDVPLRKRVQQDSIIMNKDSLITDVTYLPNPVFANLNISYTLVHAAQVYISLHYNGGATTYQTPVRLEEEGQHSVSVNMSGLPAGSYAVYIHADDTVVSGNVIKL